MRDWASFQRRGRERRAERSVLRKNKNEWNNGGWSSRQKRLQDVYYLEVVWLSQNGWSKDEVNYAVGRCQHDLETQPIYSNIWKHTIPAKCPAFIKKRITRSHFPLRKEYGQGAIPPPTPLFSVQQNQHLICPFYCPGIVTDLCLTVNTGCAHARHTRLVCHFCK